MSSGSHLSREFFELVKSIGESKSKQEEDRIIVREVQELKKLFSSGKHNPRKRVEMLVRLLYVEMLGHDASFGYIHAVQMTAGANLLHKKTAYLVSGQTLHPEHELRFMMVNVSFLFMIYLFICLFVMSWRAGDSMHGTRVDCRVVNMQPLSLCSFLFF